ncbi:MAG: A/G-specific adenine glycosylase [Chitinophagales bacterium]|nr:A/G-specific adenine glycosylase [Chitinophagales bacterium]
MDWNRVSNKREMPWKNETNPYRIWISEIILQQTRVEQGWDYYRRFIHEFPDIQSLATASEERILKLWEGLGYYSRCRNLIIASRQIFNEFNGKFPASYEEILSLKGVGEYTAAAISSFAFSLPFAVVDGNVLRVLSRFFGIATPTDSARGKKQFKELAQQLLDKKAPGAYNQAIMDFGATICKPANPSCNICPLQTKCIAYHEGKTNLLPQKSRKVKIANRYLTYLVIQHKQRFYIRKRTQKDIWRGLHEPLSLESDHLLTEKELVSHPLVAPYFRKKVFTIHYVSGPYLQKLTHQIIHAQFIRIHSNELIGEIATASPVSGSKLKSLSFPKIVRDYLNQQNMS